MAADRAIQRTLSFDGVVDFLSAPAIQTHGVELISDDGVQVLVVDMSGLTFIDSSGLSLLVYLKGRCDERHIELELRSVPARARGLIDSLGLSAYFELPTEPS